MFDADRQPRRNLGRIVDLVVQLQACIQIGILSHRLLMPSVAIDPTIPLSVTVDFQSVHRAAFRLFVNRGDGTSAS